MSGVLTVPPHFTVGPVGTVAAHGTTIVLGPGRAFGDGHHDTTHLCLQAVGALAPRSRTSWTMLDFGSGTGILAIAAAKLGATSALGVEIDETARAVSAANATLNGVADRVRFAHELPGAGEVFELVVGNILRGVLRDAASALVRCVAPGGTLVLSGLLSTDVPEITARYAPERAGRRPSVHARGEWRALVWR